MVTHLRDDCPVITAGDATEAPITPGPKRRMTSGYVATADTKFALPSEPHETKGPE